MVCNVLTTCTKLWRLADISANSHESIFYIIMVGLGQGLN